MTTEGLIPLLRRRGFPRASSGLIARRLARWTLAGLRLVGRVAADVLRGRRSLSQLGRRLREAFEEIGGTAVKLGQQLSIRVDMVPFEICNELARLNDRASPFPFAMAVARIEANVGRPVAEVFRHIQPEPIGAASIAVVYLGELLDGRRVAIKVRRPGVAEAFSADLTCFDAMCATLEGLTLARPGTFRALRKELRTMLMEELDFIAEARYQRLFRSQVRRAGIDWLSAPAVHHDLCGPDVIVAEFASGIPCAMVVAAAETRDEEALALLASIGIEPRELGERIWRMSHWSKYEALFFHADPHPGNILVQPGNRLIFLDFGACGGMTSKIRYDQQAIVMAVTRSDWRGMATAVLEDIMPMPPVDVESVKRDLDRHFVQFVRGVRDDRAEWWERCTAQIFVGFLQVTQVYDMPVPLDLLRIVRSTLLYDTLAARLHPKLSDRVFLSYLRQKGRRIGRRFVRRARRVGLADASGAPWRDLSPTGTLDWLITGLQALTWRQAALTKGAVALRALLNLAGAGAMTLIALLLWLTLRDPGLLEDPAALLDRFLHHPAVVGLAVLAVMSLRKASYRLEDYDR